MISTTQIDQWVAAAVALCFAVFALRTVVGLGLTGVARCTGRVDGLVAQWGAVVTPKLVRRLLIGALGSAAVLGPAAAAQASSVPEIDRGPVVASPRVVAPPEVPSSPGPRTAGPEVAAPNSVGSSTSEQRSESEIKVKAGDCLWGLAEAQLGPRASPVKIEKQTQRWYRLNKKVIGADPNLIHVGQILKVPGEMK